MVAPGTSDQVDPTTATRSLPVDASRSNAVAKEMGQLLLQGYKIVLNVCESCDCILLEDQQGLAFCVGCTLDNEKFVASPNQPTQRQGYFAQLKDVKVNKPLGSTDLKVMVHGVDLSEELHEAIAALKNKLRLLSQRLYSIDDHLELSECLKSMSSIAIVIERYRQIM
ncbi:protein ZNRD2 [Hyalella azteca]|uniref:Protein ZNRD2 n=1 Tax=Hyalella azteca TaxID=294128 RepID=A0A8B7P5A8_HYAAZ|nr:protein ZNRD2 [Hyalella azteca]